MSKVHSPPLNATADDVAMQQSLCGWLGVRLDGDARKVTCKRCLAKLEKLRQQGRRIHVSWEEAVTDLAYLLAGPPVQVYPPLTPDLWHSMRCLEGRQCHCELCLIDEANKPAKARWEADQDARPHRRYEHEFGGALAALSFLCEWKKYGGAPRSHLGGVTSRLTETAELGAEVQTTIRADRESLETRRAAMAVDVERACFWAYTEEQQRRGLTAAQCVAILLDAMDVEKAERKVSHPEWWAERTELSESAIRRLVSHGVRMVGQRLGEAGYMPEPRQRRVA